MSRNLDKALVQGQVVSDGVLPSLLVVAIIWKILQKNQQSSVSMSRVTCSVNLNKRFSCTLKND